MTSNCERLRTVTLNASTEVPQVALKLGSLFVYGEDIQPNIALPLMHTYARDLTLSALRFIALLRGQSVLETSRVDYPEPNDEFFGYTHLRIPQWSPRNHTAGTKELVATVSRVAAAQVAIQASLYVPGKYQAIKLFQEQLGGRWAPFVETIFDVCKLKWQYLLPRKPADRMQLRRLCQQMLEFENEFIGLRKNHGYPSDLAESLVR